MGRDAKNLTLSVLASEFGAVAFGENPLGSAGRKCEFSYASGCFCLSCQGLVLKENQVNLLL